MEDLDGKWILAKDTACPEKDASPATLGLPNMAGLQFDSTSQNLIHCLFAQFSIYLSK